MSTENIPTGFELGPYRSTRIGDVLALSGLERLVRRETGGPQFALPDYGRELRRRLASGLHEVFVLRHERNKHIYGVAAVSNEVELDEPGRIAHIGPAMVAHLREPRPILRDMIDECLGWAGNQSGVHHVTLEYIEPPLPDGEEQRNKALLERDTLPSLPEVLGFEPVESADSMWIKSLPAMSPRN